MAFGRWALALVMVAGVLQSAFAETYTPKTYMVGDLNGWTFPPNGVATFFDDWAKQHIFYQGDSLLFMFQQGFHTVLEVSQADVKSCSTSNPINTYSATNSTVTLSRTGYFGFICGEPSLCVGNIKLNLNVLAVGSPVPPPPPAPVSQPPSASGPSADGPTSVHSGCASGPRSASSIISGALVLCIAALLL